jgi:uncharacterized membrane protein YqiK
MSPLLAQSFDPGSLGVLIAAAFALLVVGFLILVVQRYKRCPSNRILVIYGRVKVGTSARCLHGGGAFVWPLIQDYDYLSLDPMQIEIPLRGALSIGEHPRQRAERVHGRDRHRRDRDAERRDPPARTQHRRS